jgi:hypothetical protein
VGVATCCNCNCTATVLPLYSNCMQGASTEAPAIPPVLTAQRNAQNIAGFTEEVCALTGRQQHPAQQQQQQQRGQVRPQATCASFHDLHTSWC